MADLDRFVAAQAGRYDRALAELTAGAKRSHWIWYVFPQIAGLGRSPTAQLYAIADLAEARAFLAHSLLGPRYRACVAALRALPADATARGVFGEIDAIKLRSSLTLFLAASGDPALRAAIARWFGGVEDAATLALLDGRPPRRA